MGSRTCVCWRVPILMLIYSRVLMMLPIRSFYPRLTTPPGLCPSFLVLSLSGSQNDVVLVPSTPPSPVPSLRFMILDSRFFLTSGSNMPSNGKTHQPVPFSSNLGLVLMSPRSCCRPMLLHISQYVCINTV